MMTELNGYKRLAEKHGLDIFKSSVYFIVMSAKVSGTTQRNKQQFTVSTNFTRTAGTFPPAQFVSMRYK